MSGETSRGTVDYDILRTDRISKGCIHPASSLNKSIRDGDPAPRWMVFQSVLQTSRTFISTCCPIEETWIQEESPEFFDVVKQRSCFVRKRFEIPDIMPGLMRKLIGRGASKLSALQDCLNAEVVADSQNNRMVVWCAPDDMERAEALLRNMISKIRERSINETHEELICGSTRALFGSGGEVVCLLTSDQFISINIANLPDGSTEESARELCEKFGPVREVEVQPARPEEVNGDDDKKKWIKVVFARVVFYDPAAAKNALGMLRSEVVGGLPLRVSPGGIRSSNMSTAVTSQLEMSWANAYSTGKATLKFDEASAANAALVLLRKLRYKQVFAYGYKPTQLPREGQLPLDSNGMFLVGSGGTSAATAGGAGGCSTARPGSFTVSIMGLPPAADEEDILEQLKRGDILPSYCRIDRASPELSVGGTAADGGGAGGAAGGGNAHAASASAKASNVPETTRSLNDEVETELLTLVPLRDRVESMTSFFQKGHHRAGFLIEYRGGCDDVAEAFKQWNSDIKAQKQAPMRFGQRIRISAKHTTTITLHKALWMAMENKFTYLIKKYREAGVVVTASDKKLITIALNVSSKQKDVLDLFTNDVSRALSFDVYNPRASKNLLFTTAGRSKMNGINRDVTYIHWEQATRTIKIYGEKEDRSRGADALDKAIAELSASVTTMEAYVVRQHWKWVMKNRYDLLNRLGLIELVIHGVKLVATGAPAALNQLGVELAGKITETPQQLTTRGSGVEELCGLCYCPIEEPYELSGCGHRFCTICLKNQFYGADNRQDCVVPFQCCGREAQPCNCKYAWSDITSLMSPAGVDFMKASAVEKFLLGNIGTYRHCVSPACQQVLRLDRAVVPRNADEEANLGGTVIFCDSCGHNYCLFCSDRDSYPVVSHKGTACAFAGKSADHRRYINQINDLLCLHCPRCSSVFLDFTGCFALTCGNGACSASFCGFCLADCGGDAHDHVKNCRLNPKKGEYFSTEENFNEIHRGRRQAEVRKYLNGIADAVVREEVKRCCAISFRDLGIQV
jgi:hypothetical protein